MNRLVLWGHQLSEYQDMFDLPQAALSMRFLEFQSGVSSFQADMREQAAHLVSYDSWFELNKQALQHTAELSFVERLSQISQRAEELDFSCCGGSLDQLVLNRREGMTKFFQDYEPGHAEGRYLFAAQSRLPFSDFFFDYALSAHHFFSASAPQSLDYHVKTLEELARAAKEVRIFPLVDGQGVPSAILGPVILALQHKNYGIEVRDVAYHLQPRGNAMLRIWAQQCQV